MKGKELTWLSKLFDDAKGEGMDCKGDYSKIARMESILDKAFPPLFQQNKAQLVSHETCRGRGLIQNGRQGATGGGRGCCVWSCTMVSALSKIYEVSYCFVKD
jgi:hypothetical protein